MKRTPAKGLVYAQTVDSSFARATEWIDFDVAADGRFLKPDTGPAGSTSSTLMAKTRVFHVFK